MKTIAINLSLFKIGWLVVVFSAAAGIAEVGAATVALIALVHLVRANRISSELALLVIAGCIGLVWESIIVQGGFLSYPTADTGGSLAPYWIVAMWVLFATTLNVSMKWLRKNLAVAALAGAVCGPLSFLAGQQAGAVTLADNAVLVIGLGWAVLLPAITMIARAFDGYSDLALVPVQTGEVA